MVLLIVALAVWTISTTPSDSGVRYTAYAAIVCAGAFLALRLMRGRT
jgi:hypothetical protein